ncbi:MAG: hypothetical protein ACFFD4_16445 [Candidatus Odinarchaeota archaeon]
MKLRPAFLKMIAGNINMPLTIAKKIHLFSRCRRASYSFYSVIQKYGSVNYVTSSLLKRLKERGVSQLSYSRCSRDLCRYIKGD